MTCVIGVEYGGTVWLAGDSSCLDVEGDAVVTQRASKVFRRGAYIIGFAGSFRVGDLLRYKLKLPERAVPHLISEAVKSCIKDEGLEDGDDWSALIGHGDKLYTVLPDYYVFRNRTPYAAIGAEGATPVVMGTLHTIEALKSKMSGKQRLKMALDTAELFSTSVRKPWRYTSTTSTK